MRRKALLMAAIVLSLALVSAGTLAYYTDRETAHNVITSGAVDISIVEKTRTADGQLVDFPAGGISGILPGATASKIVTVANIGPGAAWVRARVTITITTPDGETLSPLIEVGQEKLPVATTPIGSDWTLGADGCYYYTKTLSPGESTTPLMQEVRFAPEMGNPYQGCTAYVTVYAQAVQAANNPPPNGDVTEIPGWPGWEEGGSGHES